MLEIILNNIIVFYIFVAILILLNYFIYQKTKKYSKKHDEYFQPEKVESKDEPKSDKKLFIRKMFAIIFPIVISLFFYFTGKVNFLDLGMSTYFIFCGIILSNLLYLLSIQTYRFFITKYLTIHPDIISGKIITKERYIIDSLKANTYSFFILFIFLFILYPSEFMFGMAVGQLVTLLGILPKIKVK